MRIFSLPGFSHIQTPQPSRVIQPSINGSTSMKFVAEEYGAQLHTAVLHLDEEFHVHFYAIPKDYEMWNACRGDKASKETNSKLEAKKAMQAYQDAYYEGVSVHCGHTRLARVAND